MGGEDFNNTDKTLPVAETTANKPLPFLPQELIIIILLRLPARSLLRFKCVCKSWKTLISDTQFANNHFLISTAYPQLAVESGIDYRTWEVKTYPIQSLLENSSILVIPVSSTVHQQYKILGSCNGFLCLAYHGFGYDQVNHKYKLLAVTVFADKTETIIYTFGENSCKNVHDFPHYLCNRNYPCNQKLLGKFVSDTLNWIVDRDGRATTIISFDIEKETYRQVLLPQHSSFLF